jgi:hypothetical protein
LPLSNVCLLTTEEQLRVGSDGKSHWAWLCLQRPYGLLSLLKGSDGHRVLPWGRKEKFLAIELSTLII